LGFAGQWAHGASSLLVAKQNANPGQQGVAR
jgi:hypothetical protein